MGLLTRARLPWLVAGALVALGCMGAPTARPAAEPPHDGAYDLDHVPELLAKWKARAPHDEAEVRRLAESRADLLLVALVLPDRDLLAPLAASFEPAVEGCEPAERRCVPALAQRLSDGLEAAGNAPRAALFDAIALSWNGSGADLLSAVRRAYEGPPDVVVSAATLTWTVAFAALAAATDAPVEHRLRVLAEGVGLECPRVLPILAELPPSGRAEALSRARCMPVCPAATEALADDPELPAPLAGKRCTPQSLGVLSDHARDVVAFNFLAWASVRAVDWLVRARRELGRHPELPLVRTLGTTAVLDRIDAALAEVRWPLPPAARFAVGPAEVVTLPRSPARAQWKPSGVWATVTGNGTTFLAAAPAVVAGPQGARVGGTPLPGRAVAGDPEAALRLDEEDSPWDRAFRAVVAEAAFAPERHSVVVLADGASEARPVLETAARLVRDVGVEVSLAVVVEDRVAVHRVEVAGPVEDGRRAWLHLTPDGGRVGAAGRAPLAAFDVSDPGSAREGLREARHRLGDPTELEVSAARGVPYQRVIDALVLAGAEPDPPFDVVRLAAAGAGEP